MAAPTAQRREPARPRMPPGSRRATTRATALTLVNTTQSNVPIRSHAASNGPGSSGGAIAMVGTATASAPRLSSRATIPAACAVARVTTTRTPSRGPERPGDPIAPALSSITVPARVVRPPLRISRPGR